jgi:hypothetical protein
MSTLRAKIQFLEGEGYFGKFHKIGRNFGSSVKIVYRIPNYNHGVIVGPKDPGKAIKITTSKLRGKSLNSRTRV